jgi:DNA modification methylase
MGSGSTGIGALQESNLFVGIDMSEHYCEISERRIQEHCYSEDPVEKLFDYE